MLDSNHETPEQGKLLGLHRGGIFQQAEPASSPNAGNNLNVDRWAQLAADGQVPLPLHLQSPTREAIITRVAQLRRSRLVEFIARAIAQDIWHSRDQQMER
jgi:hypothetical protein